jgi:hypothetical protein
LLVNKPIRYESRTIRCPEVDRTARLFIAWRVDESGATLRGVQCDNPRLSDLDNWNCGWSCLEGITPATER